LREPGQQLRVYQTPLERARAALGGYDGQ